MSIIYNQMGNAYFYLQDYCKALEYHKKDLELSEQFGDESGKAKACGNIGNTLQLLGDFDEAILYSLRNLEISQKLKDHVILEYRYFVCQCKRILILFIIPIKDGRGTSFLQSCQHISVKRKTHGSSYLQW